MAAGAGLAVPGCREVFAGARLLRCRSGARQQRLADASGWVRYSIVVECALS